MYGLLHLLLGLPRALHRSLYCLYGHGAYRWRQRVSPGEYPRTGNAAPYPRFDPAYMTYDPQNLGVPWDAITPP